jgi:hypothetical protein
VQEMSRLDVDLLASQKGLCSMEFMYICVHLMLFAIHHISMLHAHLSA